MKRMILSALALLTAALPLRPAFAGTAALISFHGDDPGTWERRLAVQDLLRDGYGFDEVRVVTDATAREIPSRVRAFLEAPAGPGDRRLAWVSGLGDGAAKGICPPAGERPIRPRAASLILAPTCYGAAIGFPQGARHYALTTPRPSEVTARIGRIQADDPAFIGLLTLPADDGRHVDGADTLVFDHLKDRQAAGTVDPAALLATLRGGFRWNGSAYTPSLDLFRRGAEKDDLEPFGFGAPTGGGDTRLTKIRPARHRARTIRLHAVPSVGAGAALTVGGRRPVRVLRTDRSGAMRYVAVGDNIYGWVRRHDLGL